MEEIKKGKVIEDNKEYLKNKKTTELLSTTLDQFKEKYKGKAEDSQQLMMSVDDSFEDYKKEYNKSINFVLPEIEPIGSTVVTSKMLLDITEFGAQLVGTEFNKSMVDEFKEAVSEEQIVVAKGPNCRQVEIGDRVLIRMEDFFKVQNPNSVHRQEVMNMPIATINGNQYLSINEGNIEYIFIDEAYYKRRNLTKNK